MIREICKAGWLQQKVEKKPGSALWPKVQKTIFLPEKWYVFCIHDDRLPLLEIYSNDEGVSRHEPLETLNLNECQYISTAIEDDRTFVIAFQHHGRSSLELAALSAFERREWMEMLRFKLTRLGCLETGSNIYTPLPVSATLTTAAGGTLNENSAANSILPPSLAVGPEPIYEPPGRDAVESVHADGEDNMAPVLLVQNSELIYEPISHARRSASDSPGTASGDVQEEAATDVARSSSQPPTVSYAVINKEEKPVLPPRNGLNTCWSATNGLPEVIHRRWPSSSEGESSSSTTYDVPRALRPSFVAHSSSPPKLGAVKTNVEKYDPLPLERDPARLSTEDEMESVAAVDVTDGAISEETVRGGNYESGHRASFSFDNPVFAEDEDISRRYANGPLVSSLQSLSCRAEQRGPYSALPGRTRMVPWSILNNKAANPSFNAARSNSITSSSQTETSPVRDRCHSVPSVGCGLSLPVGPSASGPVGADGSPTPSPPSSPPPPPPLPLPNTLSMPVESGRVLPMKETEVQRLRSEMDSPLHVKVQLLLQHVVNENGQVMGLALVDMLGYVWIAGWLKRLTKQFSAALHIGDRLDSIVDAEEKAVSINSVAKAEQVLKDLWKRRCHQISLFVKRLPMGEVFVLKRAASGDDVGIALKGGKNQVVAIEEGKAASRAGMKAQCKGTMNGANGVVNYFITEVNGRPLNMFARNHEAQKRLLAVGTEITVMVQPSDFVKELRQKLKQKQKKCYKEYLVG